MIQIRPLDKKKWHGKKGQESFTQPKAVEALYDDNTGELATGLTPDLQKKYGEKLGVDLTPKFNPEVPHPFYGSKAGWVSLQNHIMTLNPEKAIDFVKIQLCKASKLVANSLAEDNEGKWPDATHVIFDEAEEVELKSSKLELKKKARRKDDAMDDMGRINMIQLITGKSFRGKSPNFISVEIEDIIENKPEEYLKFVGYGKEKVFLMASIKEAVLKGILTKEGGSIFYMGEMIGIDEDGALEYLQNPEYQKYRLSIFDKLSK